MWKRNNFYSWLSFCLEPISLQADCGHGPGFLFSFSQDFKVLAVTPSPPVSLFLPSPQAFSPWLVRSSSPIHLKNEFLYKFCNYPYRLEFYVLFCLLSRLMTCLNELQKHPAPFYWFQCLFWKERETLELTQYLICFLNGLFEVTFLMNFSWGCFFYQLDYKYLRGRVSIIFTSASTSNPMPNSYTFLFTVNDKKIPWKFDLLMMLITNMYEISLVCKSLFWALRSYKLINTDPSLENLQSVKTEKWTCGYSW